MFHCICLTAVRWIIQKVFLYKEADFGVTHAYAVMHNDGAEFARGASVQNILNLRSDHESGIF